ncbi:GNAT family N-acetyltransferase [Enterococcus faecalis]
MIIFKLTKQLPLVDLLALYNSVGWTNYTQEATQLQLALEQSLTVISAWQNHQLIGLIRAVGDGISILYIQDLLVHPAYQRQGIGRNLMDALLARFPRVRQKVLLTEEAPDIRTFYEQIGFSSCDQGELVAFYFEKSDC